MSADVKIRMANYAAGRVLLHLGCLLRGGQWRFHLTGVRRELGKLWQNLWVQGK